MAFNSKSFIRARLVIFATICLLAFLVFPGCSQPPAEPLIILDWSGYELPEYRPDFVEKYPDLEPVFTYFAADAEAFTKAQGGFEFDLVHPCFNAWKLYVDNGLVQPIDTTRIEHWQDFYPELARQGEFNGQQYFLAYDWGYESITYRTDLVSDPPTSWADLWDPAYADHLALYDDGESNHIVAALALGLDPWNVTAEQNEQITQKLMDLRPGVLTYWGDYTMAQQLLTSGDAWIVANTWNDLYLTLLAEGVPVAYVQPEEGRLGWMCGYGISANSQNVDMAYDFLNAMLQPEPQALFGDTYAYGMSLQSAVALMDQEMVDAMQINDPAVVSDTIFYQSLSEELRRVVNDRWTMIKSAP